MDRETELIGRIAGGERDAFEELYAGYASRLFGFALRITRSPELVDEVVNDTLLAVWRSAASFHGRSRPSTWIFGIAYRKALRALADRRRREPTTESADTRSDARPGPELVAQGRESLAALGHALRRLPVEQRAAVELTFLHGLSYAEIAEIVGCPVNTVKTRVFHARRKLRQSLERAGHDLPSTGPTSG
ncbi:MAG TPA: sigma-70 family RNA polymerase sigma factor [Thermoanaerobaculia bacterium]|nr:sigma-70 family RNA polymerase sigma factor [Thermoanaerobaculia bacterium]